MAMVWSNSLSCCFFCAIPSTSFSVMVNGLSSPEGFFWKEAFSGIDMVVLVTRFGSFCWFAESISIVPIDGIINLLGLLFSSLGADNPVSSLVEDFRIRFLSLPFFVFDKELWR